MSRKVMSAEVAYEVKRLYAELDERGRRRYSQMEIAKMLGVGETTVYRAVKSMGAYKALEEPKTQRELELEAEASQRRFAALAGLEIPSGLLKEDEEPKGLKKLSELAAAEAAKDRRADELLNELTGEQSGPRNPLDE